jgi:hypothetical protein
MNKKIYLHWFRDEKIGENFGDEITAYIIERLSNDKIEFVPIPALPSRMLVRGFRELIKGKLSFSNYIQVIKSSFQKHYIIGAGSILGWCSGQNAIVWGSGIIKRNDTIQPSTFLAVRGNYTINRLKELGLNPPTVIGDPAILAPLVYNKLMPKTYKIGIIGHYTHNEYLEPYKEIPGVLVINLLDKIEKVIDQINSCEKTVSTSLHGVIVSHVYGVPSLWYQLQNKPLGGDDVKFLDYFSSVKINEYAPLLLDKISQFDTKLIDSHFIEYGEVILPKIDVSTIQNNLIEVAPFEVLDKFKNKKF